MWLLSELTPRTIKSQMRLLNFEPNEGTRTAYLTQQSLADMTPTGVLDNIRRAYDTALRVGEAPVIVVLDTMGRWLSGKYLDYNAYGDMSAATTDLLSLAADLGTCHTSTLVSHHANKSHKAGAEGAIGSQALGGAFDNVINLQLKGKLYGPREISVQSRSDTNDTFRNNPLVQLILPQGELRLIQAVDAESVDSMVTQAIQDGDYTRQALERATGESRDAVLLSLGRLKKAGVVEAIGNGKALRYTLSNQPTVV